MTTLAVKNLSITFGEGPSALRAVRDVSFLIEQGESYGLIGESGSGKTTIAFSVMHYLRGGTADGAVMLECRDVMQMKASELANTRGRVAAMVYQDPMSALNPAIRVGEQIAEAVRLLHAACSRATAQLRVLDLLERVGLPLPEEMARRYPHQLSGGQQQRIIIAMALACDPKLLIMDEPTTGLDVTTEAVILDLVNQLRRATGLALLFISHNMGVIAKVCDRVGVLYAGQLVEEGTTAQVLQSPRHPYTVGLMRAMPQVNGPRRRLAAIPGRLPDLRVPPPGCIFASRCPIADERCITEAPALKPEGPQGLVHLARCHHCSRAPQAFPVEAVGEAEPAPRAAARGSEMRVEIVGLEKTFGRQAMLPWLKRRTPVRAVDDVTLRIPPGRTLAIVGESGSGKSTLARCVAGLMTPDAGAICLGSKVIEASVSKRSQAQRQAVQFIFQNPDAALNPHWTVGDIMARPLILFCGMSNAAARRRRAIELLETVNLDERYMGRFPREMSGGEKQRVGGDRPRVRRETLCCDLRRAHLRP